MSEQSQSVNNLVIAPKPLRGSVTFTERDGSALLVIDNETRSITVPDGVDVSDAAQRIFEILTEKLGWAYIYGNVLEKTP